MAAAAIPTFDDFVRQQAVEIPSFDDFIAATTPKPMGGPQAPPMPAPTLPPALATGQVEPPPTAEELGAPSRPTSLDQAPQQMKPPEQRSGGPIGQLPQVTGPTDYTQSSDLGTGPPKLQLPNAMASVPKPPLVPTMPPGVTTGTHEFDQGPPAPPRLQGPQPPLPTGLQGPPSLPSPDVLDPETGIPSNFMADEEVRKGLNSVAQHGMGDQIPEGNTVAEKIAYGLARTSLGLLSPESLATMVAAQGAGSFLPALANSPQIVALISKLPGNPLLVRQAIDFASRHAVTGAFTGRAAYGAGKSGYQAITGPADERTQNLIDAGANVILGGLGAYGIGKGVMAVSELHPPAPETPTAYEGIPPGPSPQVKAQAPGMAQALEQQGQGLAAQSWRDIANHGRSDLPYDIDAGGRRLTIQPDPAKPTEFVKLVDPETGQTLTAGRPAAVRSWIDMNVVQTRPNPQGGGALSVGGGTAEAAAVPRQAVLGRPAAPISQVFQQQDVTYQAAKDLVPSLPSFGRNLLARKLGITPAEADPLLSRLVADKIVNRAQNKTGGVVYSPIAQSPPAQSAESQAPENVSPGGNALGQVEPAPPPANGSLNAPEPPPVAKMGNTATVPDADTILGDKQQVPIKVGDHEFTLEKQPVQTKTGLQHDYVVKNADGDVVAGLRKKTVDAWLAQSLSTQAPPKVDNGHAISTPEAPKVAESANNAQPSVPEPSVAEEPTKASAPLEQHPPTFEEFNAHPEPRKFASTQVNLPDWAAKRVLDAGQGIPDSELAEDGREVQPHVTVKYGLHDNDPVAVQQALADEGPIAAKVGKVSIFPASETGSDYDVVKMDVDSPDLHRLNEKVAALPSTDTHPLYKPHITLAYVKAGEGQKYVGKSVPGLTDQIVRFDTVTHSGQNQVKTEIPLSGPKLVEPAAPTQVNGVQEPDQSTERVQTSDNGIKAPPSVENSPTPVENQPTEATADENVLAGTDKLSRAVAERLKAGQSLGDNVAFQKMARDAFGNVNVDPRDKYDALEAGVNRYLSENGATQWNAPGDSGIRALHDVENALPTQTSRTEEQIGNQQFSTPPSLALLSAKLLNPTDKDTVLEPSAGTGNLAIWPRIAGAKVVTNEIAPRRAGILKMQGFPVTNVDARHINDMLPDSVKPTAVLMNPPFSSDMRSGGSQKDTGIGIDHVEQALARMAPGGRLVAILGTLQGSIGSAKTGPRWRKIADKYNIRASVGIDGSAYRKYGTTFGNSVVVIDKTGPTPGANWAEKVQNITRGNFKAPEDAWDALQSIAADRQPVETSAGQQEPVRSVGANTGEGATVQPGRPDVVRGNDGTVQPGRAPSDAGTTREGEPGNRVEPTPRNQPRPGPTEPRQDEPALGGESSAPDLRGVTPEDTSTAQRERTSEQGGSFISYAPQRLPDSWGGVRHAANIVETASMAAIDPPQITVRPNINWDLVKKSDLSEVQLEAIAYAAQAHQQFLPSGERVGFFIGDGTGVGKGREIAGTILHYWNSGVRRVIWVSYSTDLKEDAERDLKDLGAEHIPVKLINDFKRSGDITMGDGVVFTTYSSLSSGVAGKDDSGQSTGKKEFLRINQLKDWGGESPVIIFDEAHKAKNSTEERGSRVKQSASDAGKATLGIQASIPRGHVIYSSATGATDVRNLGYASRLGLWGVGSSFDTFDDFRGAISGGGVGAMEIVARDLKAQGRYLSRFISFDGVDYREVTHKLTAPQTELYNTAAKAWQVVFQNFNKAIEVTEGGGRAKMAAMSAFWGANQRFFRQFVTSLKMPTLLREVAQARQDNKSVVISLMGTGAAQAERELNRVRQEEGSVDDVDFSAADTLIKLIEKSFPTVQYVDSVDDNGNPTKVMLLDADGRPVESKEALELKNALLEKLQGLRFPEHPIDQIISHFGVDNVAELTGRKNQFLTDPKTGKKEVHRRKKEGVPLDKTNISEARDFQSGKKHIAIISAAASTGISLHADNRAENKERRMHVVLETKWSADTQMQDFGRTHRTNQAGPPEYVLLSSNVGGEKRFLSTIARRLSQLGALTRGQRDASITGDLAKYNFESEYGTSAVASTLDAMARKSERSLGFEGDQSLVDMGFIPDLTKSRSANFENVEVSNFLNRTLGLEPERQNKVFDLFLQNFEHAIQAAKEGGTFDEGVEDIKSPSIKMVEPPKVVKQQEATGAKTYYYNMAEAFVPPRRPFGQVDATLGFYRNKSSEKIYGAEPTLSTETDQNTGAVHERVRLNDVRGGSRLIRKSELGDKYEPVSGSVARRWWDDEISKIPELDHRGLHVIGGSIMPVWNVLQGGAHGLKTVRVKTDDGQRVIGARIGGEAINRVLRGLGAVGNVNLSPEDVQKTVMDDGETLDLAGDMQLRRVTLSGEKRMEVLKVPYGQEKTVQSFGVDKEYIQHRVRYFVNLYDEAALPRLLKQYPVVGSSTNEGFIDKFLNDTEGSVDPRMYMPWAWGKMPGGGPPATKAQRKQIRRQARDADIPDNAVARVLSSDYGVKDVFGLDQNQAIDLMGKLGERLPNGILLREPHGKPTDAWMSSPSVVLPRSRAGARIWKEADRQYWREKATRDLYDHNYQKAVKGLSAEDKQKIAVYRFVKQLLHDDEGKTVRAEQLLRAAGEDPAAVDTIDQDFLDDEQKTADGALTKFVFEPMWQRGVKEGIVPKERYRDDYLPFYKDNEGAPRTKGGSSKDRAALMAADTGMPLHLADKILAQAAAKKVTFGPFDFKRGKWTLPGELSLDEIARIYIRGFARKSAQTAFLNVATEQRSKIKNQYLRDYARMYINQYAGIPQRTVFDDWIARKIHSNGLLRAVVPDPGLTAEKISMAATSLQFMAKIGLNFFTPVQHLMQISGILAKAGIFRTAQGAMKYLGTRALPNAINPWIREGILLKQSGVLGSLTNPIERPTTNRLTKKAGDALGFFLDQALDMNAGTGFFAAYFKARAEGKNAEKAMEDGRDMVRMTRYFQGRLDAPIMSRTPWLRPVYQFKTFSLKAFEMFFHNMSHVERLKYLLWTVAIGGPAALALTSLMHSTMPDSQYTKKLDDWQETASLAGFLQMPRLAKAVGVWQFPGADEVVAPYRDWWKNMAEYVAGPTINGIVGTLHAAGVEGMNLNDEEANGRAWKLTMELMKDWMPAGTALRRLGQAMQQGNTTEEQLRILFAAYQKDNPNSGLIQKISEQLGIPKLIPSPLPDNLEVR